MVGHLLLRGMIVGAVTGLLAFGFARVFGEPAVDHAISLEEAAGQAKGEAPEPELVSREVQAGLGLFTGLVTFGAALGGLFSLAFAFSYGRLTAFGPRGAAALLAACGFVALVLVPGLKYPPNPPAVGDPQTIAYRTELFFAMLALSLAAMAFAALVVRRLKARLGGWNAVIAGIVAYVALTGVIMLALPTLNEVPETFPAALLWQFRTASFGIHVILWSVLGLAFGAVAEGFLAGARRGRNSSAYARR